MTRKAAAAIEARLNSLTAWLQANGVPDEQTAWELAIVLDHIIIRLIDANRDKVTT